jgi:hypothetical protein
VRLSAAHRLANPDGRDRRILDLQARSCEPRKDHVVTERAHFQSEPRVELDVDLRR